MNADALVKLAKFALAPAGSPRGCKNPHNSPTKTLRGCQEYEKNALYLQQQTLGKVLFTVLNTKR